MQGEDQMAAEEHRPLQELLAKWIEQRAGRHRMVAPAWEQRRWATQDWTRQVQEEPNENDADQTEDEKAYDEEGKLINNEK
eukprot:4220118-Heterocapsa_arctica.AAC.1